MPSRILRYRAARGVTGRQTSRRTRDTGSRGASHRAGARGRGARGMTISSNKKKKKTNGGY